MAHVATHTAARAHMRSPITPRGAISTDKNTKQLLRTAIKAKNWDEAGRLAIELGMEKDLHAMYPTLMRTPPPITEEDTEEAVGWLPTGNFANKMFRLFDDPASSKLSKYISLFIMFLILFSCVCFVIASEPGLRYPFWGDDRLNTKATPYSFVVIESFCIVCFTIEFVARLFTVSGVNAEYFGLKHRTPGPSPVFSGLSFRKALSFSTKAMTIVDVLAILPWYLELGLSGSSGGEGLQVLRVLRLARVFRIAKLRKSSGSIKMFATVLRTASSALELLLFFIGLIAIIFGSLIFFAEQGIWDDDLCEPGGGPDTNCYFRTSVDGSFMEQTPFVSITGSLWWVLVTTTTVGYGDLVPTSVGGKIIAIIAMHLGILTLALPIGIISSAFNDANAKKKESEKGSGDAQDASTCMLQSLKTMAWELQQLDQGRKRLSLSLDALIMDQASRMREHDIKAKGSQDQASVTVAPDP